MKVMLPALALILLVSIFIPRVFNTNQNNINLNELTGEYDSTDVAGIFNNKRFFSSEIAQAQEKTDVLGVNDGQKRIEVDLTNQRLYAIENGQRVHDFLISSGKWGKTPTGTFRVWIKLRYTKMSGGSKALNTYYYLPNVPYVMYFSNNEVPSYRGFGIHGAYWHNNFGHPMSHGCINMKPEEAGVIYNWATPNLGHDKSGKATPENPGTEIVIYGVAPRT